MILILDGYNVIHAIPELARELDRSLEAARAALVSLCRAHKARQGDIERLYVVFDGRDEVGHGSQQEQGGVTVLFTQQQEEADERILHLLRTRQGKSRFVVVSNDTYIFNNARVHGAQVLSAREFYAKARSPRTVRSSKPVVAEKTTLSAHEAQRITDEYRKYLEGKAKSWPPPCKRPK